MNSIPSMDRHIQQTNDRLQCIKQVSVRRRLSAVYEVRFISLPEDLTHESHGGKIYAAYYVLHRWKVAITFT